MSRPLVCLLSCAVLSLVLSGCFGSGSKPRPKPQPVPPLSPVSPVSPHPTVHRQSRPNIVFVLTDDLAIDLLPYMPVVEDLQRQGMTFGNYFVSDSLCCPSRSSIFTGDFPHDTGVYSNTGPAGGFQEFFNRGDQNHTFNVALQRAGYATAMMGKYLNGYLQPSLTSVPTTYVPPGWAEWDVAGFAYDEFNYRLNEDGQLYFYGHRPQDYLTDVIAHRGVEFIDRAAQVGRPFFLELATFAPHSPYTPAPRDAHLFPGLTAPAAPDFNTPEIHPPKWLSHHPPLGYQKIVKIDRAFRKRAQSVQAVDDMIRSIESALAANGLTRNTYIVFSSDNGLHMGEYRLTPGKLTAFDTDIHVPLIVTGPGVAPGTQSDAMTENIDLAKTFAAIGHTGLPDDGHSLLGLLHGGQPNGWRNAVLIEHRGRVDSPFDPDLQPPDSGNPTSYEAVRTNTFLYVEYADGEREYHTFATDPYELVNRANQLSPAQLLQLHEILVRLEDCHTGPSCWAASHIDPVVADRLSRPAH